MPSFRTARREDALAIRRIARAGWHAAYGEFLGHDRIDAIVDRWYEPSRLEGQVVDAAARDDTVFLIAQEDEFATGDDDRDGVRGEGSAVGFAYAGPWQKDDSIAFLYRIYVHPGRWGDGIGTALLERVVDDLEDHFDRLRLTVLADNEVGVSFYESRGFDRLERRDARLGDDESDDLEEYVYERPLR
ncbi:GNAT family N-acetyltransferase [Natrialbaceae archaeon GCM10025810]|uniref:GNAT family N-acetyltransferase n=1 Tax=Halovalidus salilacus TaxID=3075124 RepID=UPI00361CBDC6